MKISIIGTGYVGLVSGTCFAEMGNEVLCVDVDAAKVKQMKAGRVPIYEPNLESLFTSNIKAGRLQFTTDLKTGIAGAEIIFLALPTPPKDDGSADLSYVLNVADKLGPLLKNYCVIASKSTVPVGTAELVSDRIAAGAKVPFDVVSNPEFLREGFAVTDFMKPERVVVGVDSDKAKAVMQELYGPIEKQGSTLYFMDRRSSEITKYAANAFLVTKISFMNEIATMCELVGADVDAVRLGIGSDERIGKRFLFPGIGYGGSCFPKDVMALHKMAIDNEYDFKILKAVKEINRRQKLLLAEKVSDYFKGQLKGKKFALWGLSFKPGTDDIREATSLEIIDQLTAAGAQVIAYDPEAMPNVKRILKTNKQLLFADDAYQALSGADALLIATEWEQFYSPDFEKMKQTLKEPLIFDGRNIYDPEAMKTEGFYYNSIGRRVVLLQ